MLNIAICSALHAAQPLTNDRLEIFLAAVLYAQSTDSPDTKEK